jgi:hypothetical protein
MRKKSPVAVALAVLFTVGVVAVSTSSAAAPGSSSPRGWTRPSASAAQAATAAAEAEAGTHGVKRLVLIVRQTDAQDFDVPPIGTESPGDSFMFTEDAFTPAGRLIGHDQVRCTLMFREEVFCEASFVLTDRGEIVVEGVFAFADQRPDLAVVGGTQEFRNARGQMFVLPGPTAEETKLVFALLL